jgi:anti-sigma B factor antagonist
MGVAFGIAQRELDERTSVISFEGELDLSSAPQLKWKLLDSLEAGRRLIVVDLSLCTFMDSTALGVLIGAQRSLTAGVRLAVVTEHASILRIFELAGMDGAFAIFPTLADALTRPTQQDVAEAS